MNFIKADKNLLSAITNYFSMPDYEICDFTVGCFYMWNEFFNCRVFIDNDGVFYMMLDDYEKQEGYAYTIPLGGNDLIEGVEKLIAFEKSKGNTQLVLASVPKSAAELIAVQYADRCTLRYLRNWSDYVYSAARLAYLDGHSYSKKRNHTKQFARLYPGYTYERLSKDNIDKVIEDFAQYCHDDGSVMGRYDSEYTTVMLKDYFSYDFVGGVLFLDGNAIAFTVGEIINGMLYVHIEKADTKYKGAYQMINMLFAKDAYENLSVKLINREEDLGDEGLQKSKLSYYPLYLAEKYYLEISI